MASAPHEILPGFEQADFRPFVPTRRLSEVLGVSERRVRQLVELGMPRAEAGRYDLTTCARWYIEYLNRSDGNGGGRGLFQDEGMRFQRTRLIRLKCEQEELNLVRIKGQVVPVAVVEKTMAQLCMNIREHFIRLPERVARNLEGQTARVIELLLRQAIFEVLGMLSKHPYPPENGSPETAAPAAVEERQEEVLQSSAKAPGGKINGGPA